MSQNMTLSMTPYTQAGNFVCSQYDVGRECQITLQDENGSYTIPTGATVTIQATKPSGFGFSVECTWSGSTVTFATTETMTSEFGRFPAELRITQGDTILGTTNFYFKVERSPHPEGTVDGDSETAQALTLRVDALEEQMATVQSDITDVKSDIGDLEDLETTDKSSLVGAINEARGTGGSGSGLTADIKNALLQIASKVAYIDDDGQTYYDALEDALYPPAVLVSISAVYTQSGTVYDTDTLDSLKADLVVTATYDDSSTATITTYTLSGTLTAGTSTITVNYGGKTTTFNVTVTDETLGYVDNGLTMLLDGIANGERGVHNNTISTLVDRSGNDHNWQTSTNTVTASEKALVFDGTANLAPTWTSGLSDIKTIEYVLDVTDPSTTQCILAGIGVADSSGYADTIEGTIGIKSNYLLHKTGSTYGCLPITSGRHTYTFVNDNGTWKGYKDGALTSFGSITISFKSGFKRLGSFLGRNQLSNEYFFTGSIYSVRYYSEVLSANDIASNYSNDTARFGLEG